MEKYKDFQKLSKESKIIVQDKNFMLAHFLNAFASLLKNVCMLICSECVYLLLLLFFLNHRKKCFSSVDFLFIIYETLWILILIIEVLLAQMNETFTSLFSIGLIKFFLLFNFGIIRLLIEICLLSKNNLYLDLIIVYLQR